MTDYNPASPALPDPSGAPKIPENVRGAAYIVGLVVTALSTAVISTIGTLAAAGVVEGDLALVVSALAGGVTSVVGAIASGLGVVYRPTSPH